MSIPVYSNPGHTMVVSIDSYDNCILSGGIFNPTIGKELHFNSTIEFLKQVEAVMEEIKFPQSFSMNRVFRPVQETEPLESAQAEARNGKIATFAVKVLFRQNSSWQGSVAWLDGRQEECFRSALELLMLMDSVVFPAAKKN